MEHAQRPSLTFQIVTIYSYFAHDEATEALQAYVTNFIAATGADLDNICQVTLDDSNYLTDRAGSTYQLLAFITSSLLGKIIMLFMRNKHGVVQVANYQVFTGICQESTFYRELQPVKALSTDQQLQIFQGVVQHFGKDLLDN